MQRGGKSPNLHRHSYYNFSNVPISPASRTEAQEKNENEEKMSLVEQLCTIKANLDTKLSDVRLSFRRSMTEVSLARAAARRDFRGTHCYTSSIPMPCKPRENDDLKSANVDEPRVEISLDASAVEEKSQEQMDQDVPGSSPTEAQAEESIEIPLLESEPTCSPLDHTPASPSPAISSPVSQSDRVCQSPTSQSDRICPSPSVIEIGDCSPDYIRQITRAREKCSILSQTSEIGTNRLVNNLDKVDEGKAEVPLFAHTQVEKPEMIDPFKEYELAKKKREARIKQTDWALYGRPLVKRAPNNE